MDAYRALASACLLVGLVAGIVNADVFNMGGTRNADGTWTGLASLEVVAVANPGNTGELAGAGAGGAGPDRICGAVSYIYQIGKFEVTAAQYAEFLNAVAATDTYGLYDLYMDRDAYSIVYACEIKRAGAPGNYSYTVASGWANRPVNMVDWGDAARFANWLHNGQPTGGQDLTTTENGSYYLNGATDRETLLGVERKPNASWVIPSEDEWYKAAYHKNDGVTGNYWDYPTSSNTAPNFVLGIIDIGGATYRSNAGAYTIGSPYYRTEVGAHENSFSPYGSFDQGGNLSEWLEEVYTDMRGIRGGGFSSTSASLHAASRGFAPPANAAGYINVGFRVVRVPDLSEPDTDNDGVFDSADTCPNTPVGDPVDTNGCSLLDSDSDGLLNDQDQCPNSPPGSWVSRSTGCPTCRADLDRDGDVDQIDFGILQRCASGPGVASDPNCQ